MSYEIYELCIGSKRLIPDSYNTLDLLNKAKG